jgi:hypothetical protein
MNDNTFTFVQPNFYRTLPNLWLVDTFWEAHFRAAKSDVGGPRMGGSQGAPANVPEGGSLEQSGRFRVPALPGPFEVPEWPGRVDPRLDDLSLNLTSETIEMYGAASRRRVSRVFVEIY